MMTPRSLLDLEPEWLKVTGDGAFARVRSMAGADGILFYCPRCYGSTAAHRVICWRPHVPHDYAPGPGRWEFAGTGFADLSLDADSPSICLVGGCAWHGYIRAGVVSDA